MFCRKTVRKLQLELVGSYWAVERLSTNPMRSLLQERQ